MMEIKILGKVIGTADSWDELSETEIIFYNFKPNCDMMLWAKNEDIAFNWEEGTFSTYYSSGSIRDAKLISDWKVL